MIIFTCESWCKKTGTYVRRYSYWRFQKRLNKVIKHIVLWKLKDHAEGKSRQENAQLLKEKLENLNGKIAGLIHLEVGININKQGEDDADVILYSEFESFEALESYYPHPEHKKIVPFAQLIRNERRVIDYEV